MRSDKPKPIIIIQGGQWGSEAKGTIAAYYCLTRNIDFAVRTGAINAGHTVEYEGKRYAMQQLPTGWVNPHTKLVIGAGAYIHPETLLREIEMINEAMPEADILDRLIIDYRCGVHTEEAEIESKKANRHHRMGATGKGCSEAVVEKIRNRNAGYRLFKEVWEATDGYNFADTSQILNSEYDRGAKILIEGTQGTHLDLHLGPYPFTTSRMTSAANWVAECGLAPGLNYETVLVVRTFPIRVAGNSGPMPGEIEWSDLANEINLKLVRAGRDPLIHPSVLGEWETMLYEAASKAEDEGRYETPIVKGYPHYNIRLSEWTPAERDTYRVAASELHRDALVMCSQNTQSELRKLFEMTTVTKKLRRLARLDMASLQRAVEINRPTSIALTFLDYAEPLLAGATADSLVTMMDQPGLSDVTAGAARLIYQLEKSLGVPVTLVSTGAKPENIIPADLMGYRR